MHEQAIGFIGGGNMATALIAGLLADGYPVGKIIVGENDARQRALLEERFSVRTSGDNREISALVEVLVLAVKPQILAAVASEISAAVQRSNPLIISIAAGINETAIAGWLGGDPSIVRCMPNTAALVQSSATGLHANARANEDQRSIAESILRAVGLTVWVADECQLDAVTAVSGSGPAYYFLMMEAMETAAIEIGLPAEKARLLVEQTILGAAKVALEADESPNILRRRVTSPGGTTERAIAVFEAGGLRQLVTDALTAAKARSIDLSNELGEK